MQTRSGPAAGIANSLAECAWSEADRVLAHAWRDLHGLDIALASAARSSSRNGHRATKRKLDAAADFALAVRQSINAAAQLRGLRLFGRQTEKFDPVRHEILGGALSPGAPVRVLQPGVERCAHEAPAVLARALVEAIDR